MLTEQSNDRGFSISLFSSSLCSISQVHDYFCMNVAASVNSKQKQIESECAKPEDKFKRMILKLTQKMSLPMDPSEPHKSRQNWKLPAFFL